MVDQKVQHFYHIIPGVFAFLGMRSLLQRIRFFFMTKNKKLVPTNSFLLEQRQSYLIFQTSMMNSSELQRKIKKNI